MTRITPGVWAAVERVEPAKVAEWDERLRRDAWVEPQDCYRVTVWRGWWLIYRFRRSGSRGFHVAGWSRRLPWQLRRVARRVPLLVRLGEP